MVNKNQSMEKEVMLTEQQQRAVEAVLSGRDVIVHGKAGSGKSFLINHLCRLLQQRDQAYVITAPFGVAAENVNGKTIHSTFNIRTLSFLSPEMIEACGMPKKLNDVEVVIIDEMSTVRPDIMQHILYVTQHRNIQLVLLGDLKQAQPVISEDDAYLFSFFKYDKDKLPYFYAAPLMEHKNFVEIQLDKIHRQTEQDFIDALEEVRTQKTLPPFFDQHKVKRLKPTEERGIIICKTNAQVTRYNKSYLEEIEGEKIVLQAEYCSADFAEKDYLCEPLIELKDGCQVMMMTNAVGKYNNGTVGIFRRGYELVKFDILGKAIELPKEAERVSVSKNLYKMEVEGYNHAVEIDGELVPITPALMSKYVTRVDFHAGGRSEYVSSMIQYPVRACSAITAHKCQGLQFSRVTVDMTKPIDGENLYVALSRCTKKDGLSILI